MEKDSYNTQTLSQGPHYNKIWKSYSNRDNRLGGVNDVTDHSNEKDLLSLLHCWDYKNLTALANCTSTFFHLAYIVNLYPASSQTEVKVFLYNKWNCATAVASILNGVVLKHSCCVTESSKSEFPLWNAGVHAGQCRHIGSNWEK